MLLNEMEFEVTTTSHVPVCAVHGADCLGHAIRVAPEVQLRENLDEAFDAAQVALNKRDMTTFHTHATEFHRVANEITRITGVDPRGKGRFQ